MSGIQALVFDVDGTLADTERDGHRVAFNRAFADAGLDWEWSVELYAELLSVTGGKERIRHFLDHHLPDHGIQGDLAAFAADLHRGKTHHYVAMLETGGIGLRPGVVRLLDEARADGLRLAIATTTTPENVSSLLRSTLGPASLDWFEVIGAGDVVPAKKPAPDIYTWVLERMQLAPGDVVAFEDSGHGVTSAREAGIDRILVTVNGYTEGQDFSGAAAVVDQLGEINAPCRLIGGPPVPNGLIDLAYLRAL